MGCFSLGYIENLLIWLVVIGCVFAVIKLLLPAVLAPFGGPGALVIQILTIVVYAAILIMVIIFAFELISCLLGGGFSGPRLR